MLEVEYSTALARGWGEQRDTAEENSSRFGTIQNFGGKGVGRTGDKTKLWAPVPGNMVKDT